ncbi:MAG: 6-carboxytetrahydropterin synthase QueD [Rhodospirillales bacterium CG15_BIG_FIL_POST_REV_8_21_14_020_66_15]|nr:MAG: 6-carboxytetrahydropterin synthase QueD [Rhodospirillales bacterium CG15_BIG_FIL_POST_REV_8_21_14_020_66_15]
MTVFHGFSFESARRLPRLPDSHICSRLHGNTFLLRVAVTGPVRESEGWVIDFAEVAARVEPVLADIDHKYLNEVPGLENPTTENIAIWLWDRLSTRLQGLSEIEIRENATTGCVYRGG